MNEQAQATPAKRDVLQAAAGTTTVALFGCAEKSIAAFRKSSRFWPAVSVNDPARQVFETGDYDAGNVGGFRVRMTYSESEHLAQIEIKGAGPYYTDLGVDQAMADFKGSLKACLAPSAD
jgi:hypothetical protein